MENSRRLADGRRHGTAPPSQSLPMLSWGVKGKVHGQPPLTPHDGRMASLKGGHDTMTANIDNRLRKAVYRRDHYRCVLCDSSDGIQIHHVIPRGEGGASTMQNLVTLCWRDHAFIHEGKRWSIGDDWTS